MEFLIVLSIRFLDNVVYTPFLDSNILDESTCTVSEETPIWPTYSFSEKVVNQL